MTDLPPLPTTATAAGDPGGTVALVPLRSPGLGKTRLAATLTPEERAALAGAMLADVVAALRGSRIGRLVVAASGAAAAAAASAVGAEVLPDPTAVAERPARQRLDAAVAAATLRLAGAGTLLIVAADLPHLRASDVDAVLACDAEVVVAPTRDGGTGGLVRRPPNVCGTAYGPRSAARHLALARAAGLRATHVDAAGFAHDVDVEGDLGRSRRDDALPPLGPRTAALLADAGFGATG